MIKVEEMLPESMNTEFDLLRKLKMPQDLAYAIRAIGEERTKSPHGIFAIRYAALITVLLVAVVFLYNQRPIQFMDEEFTSLIIESEFSDVPDEILDSDLLEIERIV